MTSSNRPWRPGRVPVAERRHGVPAFEQIRETVRTGPAAASERPRGVSPARLGCTPGASRAVLDDLAAFAAREEGRRACYPMADLRAAVASERAVYAQAGYVLDDTEAALAGLAYHLATLIASGAGDEHFVRMLLAPVAAQLAGVTV